MSKTPPIPPDQRVHGGAGAQHDLKSQIGGGDGHLARDSNLREQGRHGNLAQNVSATHWKTQDR